jgi:hypothetical protein
MIIEKEQIIKQRISFNEHETYLMKTLCHIISAGRMRGLKGMWDTDDIGQSQCPYDDERLESMVEFTNDVIKQLEENSDK